MSEKEIDKSEREVCARERAANDKEGGEKERVRERELITFYLCRSSPYEWDFLFRLSKSLSG